MSQDMEKLVEKRKKEIEKKEKEDEEKKKKILEDFKDKQKEQTLYKCPNCDRKFKQTIDIIK